MSTLILIANGMEARLLCSPWQTRPRELREVARLSRGAHPQMRRRSPVRDRDAQAGDAERFARRICRRLDSLRRNLGYDDIIVIAAPRFLATLRSTLRGVTRNLVSREIPRDLVHAEERQISAIAFD